MQFILVTGMSGAGKSSVVHILEDIGYYCIDNMPPSLIPNFFNLVENAKNKISKVAFVADARGRELFTGLIEELDMLKKRGYQCDILFIEASDETIIKRYKETRRKPPFTECETIEEGIKKEREILAPIRKIADHIFDTTKMLARELKEKILKLYYTDISYENIVVTIISFGLKKGIPLDCDLVFDVRFLPNPFYEPNLRPHNGTEDVIKDFVMQSGATNIFLDKLTDMIDFLLPQYSLEGKLNLVIGIGCTGGHHRSVVVAEALAEHLRSKNYYTKVHHRDIDL